MSTPPSDQPANPDLPISVGQATEAERREQRYRIAGDPAEAMKVVLAQLPDDET